MKTLILKPSSLGDVIQALPVLRLLKAHAPAQEVYWWISADLAELLEGDPDITGLYLFQRQHWSEPRYWGEFFRSIRQMRRQQFDWVIDLQGLARSGFVAWLVKGRLTVGVEDWREGAPAFYDLAVPRPSPTTHAVDWYLEVLKALHVPVHSQFTWLKTGAPLGERLRAQGFLPEAAWVLVLPGARWPNKRWPMSYFQEVVGELARGHSDLRFAVLGSKADAALGAAISQAAPDRCLDLTGRTSLAEMIEWTRQSSLVISNDTGPMHVAAALNKPVVAVFGPTDPRRTGPYRQIDEAVRIHLPCTPCLKPWCHFEKPMECLRAIGPAVVRAQAERLLAVNIRQ